MRKPLSISPSDLSHLPFGDILRRLRKAAGLSQQAVGDAWEVGQSQVSDIERGRRLLLGEDRLRGFAKVIGLSKKQSGELVTIWRGEFQSLGDMAEQSISPFDSEDGNTESRSRRTGKTGDARQELQLLARTAELLSQADRQAAALQKTHEQLRATWTRLHRVIGSGS